MSNKNLAKKLKCSKCKKLQKSETYSKRQLKLGAKRICFNCAKEKKLSNLNASPELNLGRPQGDPHLAEVTFDGDYYTKFNPENSKRTEKKKQREPLVIDNDPASARNPLGINKYTDNIIPFALLSQNRQRDLLNNVKGELKDSCDKVLDNIDDIDLQNTARDKYVSALY